MEDLGQSQLTQQYGWMLWARPSLGLWLPLRGVSRCWPNRTSFGNLSNGMYMEDGPVTEAQAMVMMHYASYHSKTVGNTTLPTKALQEESVCKDSRVCDHCTVESTPKNCFWGQQVVDLTPSNDTCFSLSFSLPSDRILFFYVISVTQIRHWCLGGPRHKTLSCVQ